MCFYAKIFGWETVVSSPVTMSLYTFYHTEALNLPVAHENLKTALMVQSVKHAAKSKKELTSLFFFFFPFVWLRKSK